MPIVLGDHRSPPESSMVRLLRLFERIDDSPTPILKHSTRTSGKLASKSDCKLATILPQSNLSRRVSSRLCVAVGHGSDGYIPPDPKASGIGENMAGSRVPMIPTISDCGRLLCNIQGWIQRGESLRLGAVWIPPGSEWRSRKPR